MPFIRGRYHINPIMGEALEAARDAEAALLALKESARRNGDATGSGGVSASTPARKGPVHRVEIEAAELVPSHSGRGQRGFAMRLHRLAPPTSDSGYGTQDDYDSDADSYGTPASLPSRNASPVAAAQADTHIFANSDDLLDFLRDELAKDSSSC